MRESFDPARHYGGCCPRSGGSEPARSAPRILRPPARTARQIKADIAEAAQRLKVAPDVSPRALAVHRAFAPGESPRRS
jgi:hypothetical protein